MEISLPASLVRERLETYLRYFIDESGVAKALKRILDEFPSDDPVFFIYEGRHGTIIYHTTTIDVEDEREINKLLRYVFYEEETEENQ